MTVVDSLLPRLGYVEETPRGQKGTVFTVAENVSGSRTELKWVIPAAVPAGVEGHVSFQVIIR